MTQSIWIVLLRIVLVVLLIAGLLGLAFGLYALGYDVVVYSGEWDGLGVFLGLLVLAVALPLAVTSAVLFRLLGRPDPSPGVVGAGVTGVLMLVLGVTETAWAGAGWSYLTVVGAVLVVLSGLAALRNAVAGRDVHPSP